MICYKDVQFLQEGVATVSHTQHIQYLDAVTIQDIHGKKLFGEVVELQDNKATIQLFHDVKEFVVDDCWAVFFGKPLSFPLSPSVLGKTFVGGETLLAESRYNTHVISYFSRFLAFSSVQFYNIHEKKVPFSHFLPMSDGFHTGLLQERIVETLNHTNEIYLSAQNSKSHIDQFIQLVNTSRQLYPDRHFMVVIELIDVSNSELEEIKHTVEEAGLLSSSVFFVYTNNEPETRRNLVHQLALTTTGYINQTLQHSVFHLIIDANQL